MVVFLKMCDLQIRVKKMQKKSVFFFRPFFFFGGRAHHHHLSINQEEKKRSPLSPSRLWSSKKKNLFGDEMNCESAETRVSLSLSFLTFYTTTSHNDGSLFFDSGSAREQSRFCKQGTL